MKKNNLDEMQEQTMRAIESGGYWVTFCGLLAVTIGQALMGQTLMEIAGELLVIFLMCGYLIIGCLRNGLWDRHLKPDRKTNLLGSLTAAGAIAVFGLVYLHGKLADLGMTLIISLILAAATFLASYLLLTVTARIYHKKRRELENE